MFPDSDLACKFQMAEAKIKYIVQFRIASYLRECLLEDMTKTPFTFLFDETTTAQVKKQYDGYVQYFSKKKNFIVNNYPHSLYLGHCTANDLKDHFFEIFRTMNFDLKYLLQISMDGPNVNLSFYEIEFEIRI